MSARRDEVVLLERESELARLDRLLGQASDAEGRLVLVEGEAGIGKTALLDALRRRAGVDTRLVLSARGGELEREFPHGVVRQLFEPVLRQPPQVRRRLFSGAAQLTETALGVGGDFPGPLVGAESELAVNHALYWLVANLAEERTLVLVVDDAHWADPATLRFLHYLARRLEGVPALVALAFRPAQPGAPTELLDALHDLRRVEMLAPAPLSEDALRSLITGAMSDPPGERFAQACHAATGGNPFLLAELLRALAVKGYGRSTARPTWSVSWARGRSPAVCLAAWPGCGPTLWSWLERSRSWTLMPAFTTRPCSLGWRMTAPLRPRMRSRRRSCWRPGGHSGSPTRSFARR